MVYRVQTLHGSTLSLIASIVSVNGPPFLFFQSLKLLNFVFNAIPYRDPAFHSTADPDPVSHNNVDPLGGQIWVPWIKIKDQFGIRRGGKGVRQCDASQAD